MPVVHLTFEPKLSERVAKAKKQGKVAGIEDCEDLMKDEEFVNALAQNAAKWTRDIQAVTRTTFEIGNGSTL